MFRRCCACWARRKHRVVTDRKKQRVKHKKQTPPVSVSVPVSAVVPVKPNSFNLCVMMTKLKAAAVKFSSSSSSSRHRDDMIKSSPVGERATTTTPESTQNLITTWHAETTNVMQRQTTGNASAEPQTPRGEEPQTPRGVDASDPLGAVAVAVVVVPERDVEVTCSPVKVVPRVKVVPPVFCITTSNANRMLLFTHSPKSRRQRQTPPPRPAATTASTLDENAHDFFMITPACGGHPSPPAAPSVELRGRAPRRSRSRLPPEDDAASDSSTNYSSGTEEYIRELEFVLVPPNPRSRRVKS